MTDTDLHEANRLAHEVARAVLKYLESEGSGSVYAYLDMKEAAENYERICERVSPLGGSW